MAVRKTLIGVAISRQHISTRQSAAAPSLLVGVDQDGDTQGGRISAEAQPHYRVGAGQASQTLKHLICDGIKSLFYLSLNTLATITA
jgi:hypothetical protein